MSHHLVGVAEVAEMLGVSRQRVNQLVADDPDFPSAECELSAGRVWLRESIETWIASNAAHQKSGASAQAVARMSERFAPNTRRAIAAAGQEASDSASDVIEPEHLLGGLVRLGAESPVGEVIATLDLDLDDIRRTYPERRDTRPAGSVRPAQSRVGRFSRRTASVLEHAFRHAYFRSQKKLTPVHVLLAMLSVSPEVFEALGIDLGEREDATLSLWSEFGPRIKRELAQTVATVRVAPPNVRVGPSGPVLSRRRDRPAKDIRGLLAEIVTRLEAIERRLDQA